VRGGGEPLVLSLFPGIDLFGRAFEEEGFCVVRGPDPLWGGDIRDWHVPACRFDGVIGGPPCKGESRLAHLNGVPGQTMRDEFWRVVEEAAPEWFVMEAVVPHARGGVHVVRLNNRWTGHEQNRVRYFHSNLKLDVTPSLVALESPEWKHAVLAGHGPARGRVKRGMTKYEWREACRLQGLPEFFDLPGFRYEARYEALGNGVPLPMGSAIARAVRQALGLPQGEATA
jgi:DNA (cytosine-5)-methyltransferase 1